MLIRLLLFISLFVSFSIKSQTLYWVGGSGNLNDKNHWSLTSGGIPSGIYPSANTDLIFDDNSSANELIITITGYNHVKSIQFKNLNNDYYAVGSHLATLRSDGDFILNTRTHFNASANLLFTSSSITSHIIDFTGNKINSNVTFESGVWDIKVLKIDDAKTLKFNKGTYNFNNCLLMAGNLIANSDHVVFNTFKSPFRVSDKLILGNNVSFNSNDFILLANKNNPQQYQVNSNISFGQHSRVEAIIPSACGVTTSFTNSPCGVTCQAAFALNFDAGCTDGPYDIIFTTLAPCIPSGTNGINPPALVFSNLCNSCAGYQVDGVAIDQSGNFWPFSGTTHQVVTPIAQTTLSIVSPSCFGDCNGSISFFLSSGKAPYKIEVNPLAVPPGTVYTNVGAFSTRTVTGLCAGVQTFSVTDNNGCVQIFTQTIAPTPSITANGTSYSITCNASCNGSITLAPTGGNGSYSYTWSPGNPTGQNTATISNLCPGTYSVSIRDPKNCPATFSATISQPPAVTLTINKTDLICGNICDGTASVTPTGGLGAFTYTLQTPTGGSITSNPPYSDLCAGTYTLVSLNNGDCINTKTFTIISPPTLTATPTQTNLTCNSACIGAINVNASGGTGALAYSWVPSPPTGSVVTNLCAGDYVFTVTDALSCTFTQTVTITQPPAITVTVTDTDLTCNGVCNGTGAANTSGGTGAFSYTWSPTVPPIIGQSTPNVSNLCAGNYSLNVKDAAGCAANTTFTITEPPIIAANITSVSPTCNGSCNGSINSNPSGGTGAPFTYTLQTPSSGNITSNPPFTNLCVGAYTLLVADAGGCVKSNTVTLIQPNPLTLTLTPTQLNCFGGNTGAISANPGGGTATYTVNWSTGQTGLTIINLIAGVYTATVTDLKGCQKTATATITSPPQLTVTIAATNPNCFNQCTGIATASVTGGTQNYTITWSNGPTGTTNPNLCAGVYTANVVDFKGCTAIQTVTITTPTSLTVTAVNDTVSCFGSCDGSLTANPSGGTAPYFYNWSSSPTQTTQTTLSNLCPGNYNVTVTDSKGCIRSTAATVAPATVLTATIGNVQPSCNVCIGSATGQGVGGTSPYTYLWSNTSTTQTASNLCVGIHTLTVTDSKNCTATQTVQITQAVNISITANSTTLACNNVCSGMATANASGGTNTFTYSWVPTLQTAQTATALCSGVIHTVVATDGNGCSNTNTVSFVNPPAITLTVNHTDVTCSSGNNGTASALATGGTGAISYIWQTGGATTPSIGGLIVGDYTVTATDINGCNQSSVVTIAETTSLSVSFTNTNPSSCTSNDGSIAIVPGGGTAPYNFTLAPVGATTSPVTNLSDGTYTLTLVDSKGCTQSFTTTLSDPLGPTIAATTTSINCFAVCNGSATLSVTAATPSYTLNWNGAATTNTVFSGLCASNNVASVIDQNGCITNQTVTINEPTQITSNGIIGNATCNGVCTGSVNLTASGGTPTYTFSWSNGNTNEDPTNLCVGDHTVTITDANNCVVTNTYVIAEPIPLTLSFNKKDVLCNGGCTGAVGVDVTGGNAPYIYSWTPSAPFAGSALDTIVNLCTGVYTVTVTDGNNCTITDTVRIGEPSVLTATVVTRNAKCNGQCNGSAVTLASGGTTPYNFFYNTIPATLSATVTNLCAGNYSSTVTDANGCVISNSFVITQPLPIVITTTVTNPLCNAGSNGSVLTNVTGGNTGYTYNWSPNGGNAANPVGLPANNYTLTVTDDSLCTAQTNVSLTNPLPLLANTTFTNPTCNNGCNGIVSTNPVGGQTPYSFSWSSPTFTSQTVTNLCAANYTVVVTDNNSCQVTQTVTLTDPSAMTINAAVTPATCGFSDGSIDASAVVGGLPTYTYNWLAPIPGGQATNTVVTNIPAGIYTVVVTDASACSATITIPVSTSNGPSDATMTTTMVTCQGQCDGAAIVSDPVGGTSPYTMSWLPSTPGATITNLCAGTYTSQITDVNGCVFFKPVTITEPQGINANEVLTSATCFGNCNGSIALNPTGGNAGGYTYSWSNGAITATVGDSKGCTLISDYNLPSVIAITANTVITNNSCFDDRNATALVTNVAGGTPTYSFSWTDPLGQTNALATGLSNGTYSVTITDNNGCFIQMPITIVSPSQVTFTPNVTQPTCGQCDGAATINPVGGVPSYSVIWSGGVQSGFDATSLCAGVYMVSITDGNGCLTDTNIIINSSSTITGETITQADVSCASVCDGSVTVAAIGGTAPITYNWVHGPSGQTLTNLCPGTYFCNMMDANGCIRTASVTIGATTSLSITSQVNQSQCTSNTGAVTTTVTGGTGVYTYAWLPASVGSTTNTATSLAPGIYTLTVTDGNGCSQQQVFAINSINGPVLTYTQQNISCAAVCNGSVGLTISGGSPGYTTLWSTGAITTSVTNLCAGSYSVEVTDLAGCKAVQNFSLTTTSPIVFSAPDVNNPLCNNNCNGSITSLPSGGTLPYTFVWTTSSSTLSSASTLCTGNYSITVTDANGCSAVEDYTLTGPTSITVTAVVTDADCNGASTGNIDVTVTGGTPIPVTGYTYSWTPVNITTQDITNTIAGTYNFTVTDNNGCEVDSSFVIAEPTVIDDNETIIAAQCFGNCNGSIALAPTGGNGSYTYSWSPTANTGTISNQCPGVYTATITDTKGCTLVSIFNLPSVVTITAAVTTTDNICFIDCRGIATVTTIAGGQPPYSLQWTDPIGQLGNTANNLCTGTYSVKVMDSNGCFDMIPATIVSPSQVTFTPNVTQPTCGQCDGAATINPVGGVPSYSVIWSGGVQSGFDATSLCAGVYMVSITDGNGCLTDTNIIINSSSTITGETITQADVSCAGVCDGSVTVTAIGGTAPITYNWVHGPSGQTLTNLCPGTYFCNMMDANGCVRTASVTIGATTSLSVTSQVTQSSCSVNTGAITTTVTGGTGVYTYAWLPASVGSTTNTATSLAPGIYTVIVTDGNGCSQQQVFAINSINGPVLTYTQQNISCAAVCNGSIALTISGGSPGYTTLWSNGVSTPNVTNLCAGSYSVEVTDLAGCKAVQNFSLTTTSPIVFSAPDVNNPLCNNNCNGSITSLPSGGTLPYTYTWTTSSSTLSSASTLCTGNYSITVTDANGCSAIEDYTLTGPTAMTVVATTTVSSCSTVPDAAIDITVSGGMPIYTYSWSPNGAVTEDLIPTLSGNYTVTITDANGCAIDSAFQISTNILVDAIAGNDSTFCQNALFTLNGSNSVGGDSYQWQLLPAGTFVSNTLITNVTPAVGTNSYVLIATTIAGCNDRDTVIVTSNALPNVDAGPMVSVSLLTPAQIGGNPTCPTGVSYTWSPGFTLDNSTGTNPTTTTTVTTVFTVTVVDGNGCINSDTVTVYIFPEIKIPNGFSPNADGKNDTWVIDFIQQFPNCEVEVYNRWGEQLFYSKGYTTTWNGQYKGKNLPVGTYYYVINLNEEKYPKPYTGPLTIFR